MDNFEELMEEFTGDEVKATVSLVAMTSFVLGLVAGILLGMLSKGLKVTMFSNNKIVGNGTFKAVEKKNKKADKKDK